MSRKKEKLALDEKEGRSLYYNVENEKIEPLSNKEKFGQMIEAQIYAMAKDRMSSEEGIPSFRYLAILIEGAKHFDLPNVQWLEQHPW